MGKSFFHCFVDEYPPFARDLNGGIRSEYEG
jgi:hypothetical protein